MTENLEGKRSKIHQSMSKIFSGFLTGIGFSIALIIVFVLAGFFWDYFNDEAKTEKEDIDLSSLERHTPSFVEYDENSGLIIENHELRRSDSKLTIIGQIKNTGQESWERTHLQIELFDSNKNFLDQCSGLVWGILRPTQTRNFKVTCGECNNEPIVEFSTYEIEITDASHSRTN